MTDKLEPCPFCGGEARLFGISQHRERAHIECMRLRCRLVGPPFRKDRDAVAAWNTRAAHSGEGRSYGAGDDAVERVAQWLHDEGGFGDSFPGRTWPEHPDDTGQREGGWVKIVPSDVQAFFRDVARRLLTQPAATALTPQGDGEVERLRAKGVPVSDWSWWVGSEEVVCEEGLYDLFEAPTREYALDWASGHINPGERFFLIEARTRSLSCDMEFMPFVAKRNATAFMIDDAGSAVEIPAPNQRDTGEALHEALRAGDRTFADEFRAALQRDTGGER